MVRIQASEVSKMVNKILVDFAIASADSKGMKYGS